MHVFNKTHSTAYDLLYTQVEILTNVQKMKAFKRRSENDNVQKEFGK
jgi:hypothetical protein